MNIKKHIPNTITLGNLLCGCLAIVKAFEGDLVWSAYLVGIALILDFFDGFFARLLKVSSPIGKDLDSLADMVTFGVVPGVVVYKMIVSAMISPMLDGAASSGWTVYPSLSAETTHSYLPLLGFSITIFSCIRLAKFNNDTRQSDSFIGVPTPANAMVICSFPLIVRFQPDLIFLVNLISNAWFLIILSGVMSFLLISELPLFALKFKNFGWADNKIRFVFLLLSVVMLVGLKFLAIPIIIILYILLSIVNNIFLKKKV